MVYTVCMYVVTYMYCTCVGTCICDRIWEKLYLVCMCAYVYTVEVKKVFKFYWLASQFHHFVLFLTNWAGIGAFMHHSQRQFSSFIFLLPCLSLFLHFLLLLFVLWHLVGCFPQTRSICLRLWTTSLSSPIATPTSKVTYPTMCLVIILHWWVREPDELCSSISWTGGPRWARLSGNGVTTLAKEPLPLSHARKEF